MRRITLWLLSTISALVILFSYSTSTPGRPATSALAAAAPAQPAVAPSPSPSPEPAVAAVRTATGDAVPTPYGPVQVKVNVQGDQVTDVQVLQVPWSNGRDQQINGRAVPILIEETTAAGNAQIDMVSGATYTSRGYLDSLQSALDQL